MSVYTVTVFSGAMPTSQATLHTVPAGEVFVVKNMIYDLFASGAGAPLVGVSIPGFANSVIWQLATVVESVTQFWAGRVALPAGSTIYGSSPSPSNTLLICGFSFPN